MDFGKYNFAHEAALDYKIMLEFASTLKQVDREIILMYLYGEKQSFIAQVLGLTESNVSSKINRLKQTIQDHMNKGISHEE